MVSLWLATHSYRGIVGDARFYNVQFLHALNPAAYQADLYFAYGSQDEYSIFTTAFAPVIRLLGLNAGNIVLNLVFQTLWLTGLWSLATALLTERRARILAMAAVIALPGEVNFVHYGEPLLTPRLLAEALTLWALAAMLRRRLVTALAILLLAASVHPLMAMPGLGVLFLHAARGNRLWWAVLPLAACIAGLAALGVPPFSALAATYDPAWFATVNVRDGFCFIGNWRFADWLPVCTTLILSLIGLCFATPGERRLLAMALAVAVGGLATSFVGADLLHLVLVTDAQLWRTTWLLAVIANFCLATTLMRGWSGGGASVAPAAVLAVSAILLAVARLFTAVELVAAPLALVGWFAAYGSTRHRPVGPRRDALLIAAVLLATVMAAFAVRVSAHILAIAPEQVWPAPARSMLAMVCLAALGMVALCPVAVARSPRRRVAANLAVLSLLAVCVTGWDQRPGWRKFIETGAPPNSLLAQVPPGSTVYWEGDVTVPWLLLRQASYFSCEQGTGALFKRGTAMAFQHRSDSFSQLGTIDFWRDPYCPGTRNRFAEPITHADLSSLCQREPALDKLVLTEPATDDPGAIWLSPVAFRYPVDIAGQRRGGVQQRFHVYDCAGMRQG